MPRRKATQTTSNLTPEVKEPVIDKKAIKKLMLEFKLKGKNFKHFFNESKYKDLGLKVLRELWEQKNK